VFVAGDGVAVVHAQRLARGASRVARAIRDLSSSSTCVSYFPQNATAAGVRARAQLRVGWCFAAAFDQLDQQLGEVASGLLQEPR
jgi:hypothetical protein